MILVVSDVHLGYEKQLKISDNHKVKFLEFTKLLKKNEEKIDYLILLGDILDYWRRYDAGVMFENIQLLQDLSNLEMTKYYVVGNHDYSLTDLRESSDPEDLDYSDLPFKFTDVLTNNPADRGPQRNISKKLFGTITYDEGLRTSQTFFRFIHGYQIKYCPILPLYKAFCRILCHAGDKSGEFLSDIWDAIQFLPKAISAKIKKKLSGFSTQKREAFIDSLSEFPTTMTLESVDYDFQSELIDRDYLTEVLSEPELRTDILQELIELETEMSDEPRLLNELPTILEISDELSGDPERSISDEKIIDSFLEIWQEQTGFGEGMRYFTLEGTRKIHPRVARIAATFTTKLRRKEYLIYGHTHELPYTENKRKIANTGCWIHEACSALTIDEDGAVEAHITFDDIAKRLERI